MATRVHLPAAVAPLAVERLHSLVENRTVYALDGFELKVKVEWVSQKKGLRINFRWVVVLS